MRRPDAASRTNGGRPTVLLFDIDGTLITTGGAGRRAMHRAFERHAGRPDACEAIPFAGMTDRAIVRAGLGAIGATADEAAIDAVLAVYLDVLAEEVALAEGYRVHDGIAQALERATGRAHVAIGLGTGNVKPGALLKLARVGLADTFAFGGFGCDHEDRAELLRIGAERGAARVGASREECRVVIIGDTPRDVAAATAIGAESIAVATGIYAADALDSSGATWTFADLAAPGALDALFGADGAH